MYIYKVNPDRYLVKYKVRLVIRGDEEDKVAEDNYTATLAVRSFRIIIVIVTKFDLDIV